MSLQALEGLEVVVFFTFFAAADFLGAFPVVVGAGHQVHECVPALVSITILAGLDIALAISTVTAVPVASVNKISLLAAGV